MRHASLLKAMSGIACEKMRLGVADELQVRAVIRNKEWICLGDGDMMTFQMRVSSRGGQRPLSHEASASPPLSFPTSSGYASFSLSAFCSLA
jgi:hypothetical protein